MRERLEQHRSDPACAGCHQYIDPPGYLFENYDSVGRYREEAEGHPIDATGDLDGMPLNHARDLAAKLSTDPRVTACLVRQTYRHAVGRLESENEQATVLAALVTALEGARYDFAEFLVHLVLSEGFRTVGPVTQAEETP